MKIDQDIPSSETVIKLLNDYLEDSQKIQLFLKSLNIEFKGEIDFIINNVANGDIKSVLSDNSKKYFVFGDEALFTEEISYSCEIGGQK